MNRTPWTEPEVIALRAVCAGDAAYSLDDLASRLGRTRDSVALKISRLGLGSHTRACTPETCRKMSEHRRGKPTAFDLAGYMKDKPNGFKGKRHKKTTRDALSVATKLFQGEHGHPKGMLGKHHSQATKQVIAAAQKGKQIPTAQVIQRLKTQWANHGRNTPRRNVSWKQAWREIGNQRIFARSRWEANYARFLEFRLGLGEIIAWEHEPDTFWFVKVKRGCVSYVPDFKVIHADGRHEYHEVKGWMDAKSKTKLKRMAKYHPAEKVIVIGPDWFKRNRRTLSKVLPGWESAKSELPILPGSCAPTAAKATS